MNGTNITHEQTHDKFTDTIQSAAAGSSAIEALSGVAAVVLSIIGLAGGLQPYMAAIAVILIGASLLCESGTMAASYRRLLSRTESSFGSALGGTMTLEFLAGITGIVLGILALLNISVWTLTATAAVIFGCVFMLNSGSLLKLHSSWAQHAVSEGLPHEVAHEALSAGAGGHMMIGLAAVVLGILALVGINFVVLTLVALLALGVSVMLSGSFMGAANVFEKKIWRAA